MRRATSAVLMVLGIACGVGDEVAEPIGPSAASAPLASENEQPYVGGVRAIADGGRIVFPQVIKRVVPVYPAAREGERVRPSVRLQVVISEAGDVREVRILDDPENRWAQAAADAVKQWKYRPGSVDGRPTEMLTELRISINFR